jgi:hypothetical protein
MMGRTFAFRVKWQKEWRQGPILEIKDDKLLAGKIQQQVIHFSFRYNYNAILIIVNYLTIISFFFTCLLTE